MLGTVLDRFLPDPRRGHPVALFGRAASALEKSSWADDRRRGIAFSLACVGPTVAVAAVVERRSGRAHPLIVMAATWAVLGSRSLRTEAGSIEAFLRADDLAGARRQVTHLVGRDPSHLDAAEIARATIESVAENTADAIVAPLFWGAVAGVPGLVGYRAINTLDAMVGHRSPRYANFGWASARLDDVANIVPARLTALFVAAVAPVVGGDAKDALRVARRDGRAHPSPNSGLSEAAFAGALDLQLGGRNVYEGRVEDRPVLGDGKPVVVEDIERAARLCAAVTVAAAVASAALAYAVRRSR